MHTYSGRCSVKGNMDNTTGRNTTLQYGVCLLDDGLPLISFVTILVLLAMTATIENLMAIIVILRYKVLRSSFILLCILSLINLITGCIVTPIKIWITLKLDYTAMWAFASMFHGTLFFSLGTVLMISIDRFCYVYFLERYKMTTLKLFLGLCACWTMPLGIWITVTNHMSFGIWWLMVSYFFFCIFTIIITCTGTIIILYKHTTNSDSEETEPRIENQRNAITTNLMIILACVVTNTPPILNIILGLNGIYSRWLCSITFFAILANSAVYPLVFCYRVPLVKKHIKQLLCKKRMTTNDGMESEDAFLSDDDDQSVNPTDDIEMEMSQ